MEIETKLKINLYWEVDNSAFKIHKLLRECHFPLLIDYNEYYCVGSLVYDWPQEVWRGASFDKIASCRRDLSDDPGDYFNPLSRSCYNYEGEPEKIKSLIERDIKFHLNNLLRYIDKEITVDDKEIVHLIPELIKYIKIKKETGESCIPAYSYYDLETKTWIFDERAKACAEERAKELEKEGENE